MVPTKLAGMSIFLMTLSFRTLAILGESVLTSEIDKSGELKDSDKRGNNFGVPMEMPYDTNFWPSRGRRARPPSSDGDMCYLADVELDLGKRCGPPKAQEEVARRKWPVADTEDSFSEGTGSGCCEPVRGGLRGVLRKKSPELYDVRSPFVPKRFEMPRNEKQRQFLFPRVLLYGNGVFWKQENPFGEKRKKEDVFWVARGKK